MRKYDVAYVPNVPRMYPPIDYKKLDLKELVERYIKPCAKANGVIAVCSKCQTPCEYGKRAIQLLSTEVYNDPPIPLYGGKTMIENAREENMIRRMKNEGIIREPKEEKEEKKEEKEEKKEEKSMQRKHTYVKDDNWWENSLASGNQVKWLIENHKITKHQAQRKIYSYKRNHGIVDTTGPIISTIEMADKQKIIGEPKNNEENKRDNDVVITTLEQKINMLMLKQEEYKALADKYQKLYMETKEQVDILCKAMDLF